MPGRPSRSACTTRPMSTTPAASRSSRGSTATRRTRRSAARSSRWRTSSTAAPRAPTRTPATAPGSCCRSPTSSCAVLSAATSRRPGRYGVGVCFLPQDEEQARGARGSCSRTPSRPRASAWSAGATCRSTRTTSASRPATSRPYIKQLVVAARASSSGDQDAFERKLYVIRRVAELAAGPELVIPSFSSRTIVYKGMLTAPQLLGFYPDLQDPRAEERAGARPLALLDQHVPELGARAPVPADRPQRRDQHAARQRQLDARPRVPARLRAVRRRPAEGAAGRARRRLRLGDLRQRARAARAGRPLAAARDDDDGPRGLRGPRRPARRAQGASTPSTPA